MDDIHQRLGESLLSKYRAGKLTKSVLKQEILEASAAVDYSRRADVVRALVRRLKYICVIKDDSKMLEEFWKATHEWSWQEGGSGI